MAHAQYIENKTACMDGCRTSQMDDMFCRKWKYNWHTRKQGMPNTTCCNCWKSLSDRKQAKRDSAECLAAVSKAKEDYKACTTRGDIVSDAACTNAGYCKIRTGFWSKVNCNITTDWCAQRDSQNRCYREVT